MCAQTFHLSWEYLNIIIDEQNAQLLGHFFDPWLGSIKGADKSFGPVNNMISNLPAGTFLASMIMMASDSALKTCLCTLWNDNQC